MKTRAPKPESNQHENLIVIVQQVGATWRCLFASARNSSAPEIVQTTIVDNSEDLEALLLSEEPTQVFSILPGSATVCRTTSLPDVDSEQILEALRLQAESKFLGSTPDHRRAIAALENSIGETNRVGLIIAWPEATNLEIPSCLKSANFIPDVGSIAALLDGLRPTEPILYADPSTGTVTLALSHANGAALRATREDASTQSLFIDGISRIVRETASAHNHTSDFTASLIDQLQSSLRLHLFDTPILLLPKIVIEHVSHRVLGSQHKDETWWSTWGITIGGLITATGPLSTLTTMQLETPILHPSMGERFLSRCNNKSIAVKLSIAALLVLALGPALLPGVQLSILNLMHPDVDSEYARVVESRKQQIVYKELGKSAWPMTKITADIANNVPIGIEIDSIRINLGEPISISGRALNHDGKSAAELIASMQANLQSSGQFKDIQFAYDPAGIYGDRKFDLWASVPDPLMRSRYAADADFGRWTYAMRQAGLEPEEAKNHIPVGMTTATSSGESPMSASNPESSETASSTPPLLGDEDDRTRERRRRPGGGGDGISKHTDNPSGSGASSRVPDPLDPGQISLMSETEARVALTDVTEGLKHLPRGDKESKDRLRNEMRLLLDRLKDTQK